MDSRMRKTKPRSPFRVAPPIALALSCYVRPRGLQAEINTTLQGRASLQGGRSALMRACSPGLAFALQDVVRQRGQAYGLVRVFEPASAVGGVAGSGDQPGRECFEVAIEACHGELAGVLGDAA